MSLNQAHKVRSGQGIQTLHEIRSAFNQPVTEKNKLDLCSHSFLSPLSILLATVWTRPQGVGRSSGIHTEQTLRTDTVIPQCQLTNYTILRYTNGRVLILGLYNTPILHRVYMYNNCMDNPNGLLGPLIKIFAFFGVMLWPISLLGSKLINGSLYSWLFGIFFHWFKETRISWFFPL